MVMTKPYGTNIGGVGEKKDNSYLFWTMKNFNERIFLPLSCNAEPRIFWTLNLKPAAQEPKIETQGRVTIRRIF